MEAVVKASLVAEIYKEEKKLFLEKGRVAEMLSMGMTSFEALRTKRLAPKESRMPSASGSGKVLFHIADIVEYQMASV